jgi:hypothetical protein
MSAIFKYIDEKTSKVPDTAYLFRHPDDIAAEEAINRAHREARSARKLFNKTVPPEYLPAIMIGGVI